MGSEHAEGVAESILGLGCVVCCCFQSGVGQAEAADTVAGRKMCSYSYQNFVWKSQQVHANETERCSRAPDNSSWEVNQQERTECTIELAITRCDS